MLRATTACTFSTSEPPKVVRTPSAFNILTWKCASHHNGANFSTSQLPKVVRELWCVFIHFDLETCFAPQRRALFRHLNCQKWSAPLGVLYILTWKCASRHNGVRFFDISTSKSGPKLVCFVHFDLEMCFAPQTACNFSSLIWPAGSAPAALASLLFGKTQCFATFLPFRASASSFF